MVHTVSWSFVTAENNGSNGSNGSDRLLQIGFVTSSTAGFNAGFSFISARVYANHQVEFQSGNGAETTGRGPEHHARPPGPIANGALAPARSSPPTQETACLAASWRRRFRCWTTARTGVGVAPTNGARARLLRGQRPHHDRHRRTPMDAGFPHTPPPSRWSPTTSMVDSDRARQYGAISRSPAPAPAGTTLKYLRRRRGGHQLERTSSSARILSTVTLTLSHGTFSNGQTTVSAQAVDGRSPPFTNLQSRSMLPGSYILMATDDQPRTSILGLRQLGHRSSAGVSSGLGVRPGADGSRGPCHAINPRRHRRRGGRFRQRRHEQHVHRDADSEQRHVRRRHGSTATGQCGERRGHLQRP